MTVSLLIYYGQELVPSGRREEEKGQGLAPSQEEEETYAARREEEAEERRRAAPRGPYELPQFGLLMRRLGTRLDRAPRRKRFP